jgi:hypothetical protein
LERLTPEEGQGTYVPRSERESMSALGTHGLVTSECVFRFGDAAAALANDRKLGERERVVRFQFDDLFRVSDRFVELAELLHHHCEREWVGASAMIANNFVAASSRFPWSFSRIASSYISSCVGIAFSFRREHRFGSIRAAPIS